MRLDHPTHACGWLQFSDGRSADTAKGEIYLLHVSTDGAAASSPANFLTAFFLAGETEVRHVFISYN